MDNNAAGGTAAGAPVFNFSYGTSAPLPSDVVLAPLTSAAPTDEFRKRFGSVRTIEGDLKLFALAETAKAAGTGCSLERSLLWVRQKMARLEGYNPEYQFFDFVEKELEGELSSRNAAISTSTVLIFL